MGSTVVPKTTEGFELQVSGPLSLGSEHPESLTWLAKMGSYAVGWVRLSRTQHQVALIRELHLSDTVRNPLTVATRLLSCVCEYARDHSLLKLKIHPDCSHDWLRPALSHAGFSHADERPNPSKGLQVYVDLYRSPRSKSHRAVSEKTGPTDIRLAC